MDAKDLNRFKILLETERQRIINNFKNSLDEISQHTQDIGDEADDAQNLCVQELILRFKDRDRQLLNKINIALNKIKDGSFGSCEDCEEDIGIKRIEARPTATLCVKCKEAEERLEKTFIPS